MIKLRTITAKHILLVDFYNVITYKACVATVYSMTDDLFFDTLLSLHTENTKIVLKNVKIFLKID